MKTIRVAVFVLLSLAASVCAAQTQSKPLSQQLADDLINSKYSEIRSSGEWVFMHSVPLEAVTRVWQSTGDPNYFNYVRQTMDRFLNEDGTLRRRSPQKFYIEPSNAGPTLLMLYGVTGETKYYKAAAVMREELRKARPDAEQGIATAPFMAQYSSMFHESTNFDTIADSLIAGEPRPPLWAGGTGSYLVSLVNTLPYFPEDHPKRGKLLEVLNRQAEIVSRAQDSNSGVWHLYVVDPPGKQNPEAPEATGLFVYAIARGLRLGYLPLSYVDVASRAYTSQEQYFRKNTTYRGVHFDSRISSFLMPVTEMEMLPSARLGLGKTVLLDSWFNNETRKDVTGTPVIFHYKWNEMSMPGYWFFGNVFRMHGVQTKELFVAPTTENLKQADIYMIVNPDNTAKIAQPNYMDDASVKAIADWVKAGGVLVMMENNKGNSDFEHFNKLSETFGIHFNEVTRNTVDGDKFEQAKIIVAPDNPILKKARQIYMKEISTITPKPPAKAVLEDKGDVLMAVSRVGEGTVLAVVDPWLYNEYVDGRRLPPEYQNFTAAQDVVRWLLEQMPKK